MVSEVIELAGNKAQDVKKSRILPRHLMLAIKDDAELNHLLGNADFCQSGVPPKIYPELINHGKKGKGKGEEASQEDHWRSPTHTTNEGPTLEPLKNWLP